MIRCTEAGGLSLIEGKTKAKAGRGDLRVGFGTRFELTRNWTVVGGLRGVTDSNPPAKNQDQLSSVRSYYCVI